MPARSITQSWHFACHGCGACCNSGPALTFAEIGNYADDFHIRLAFQAVPLHAAKEMNFPWGTQRLTTQQMAKIKENEKRLWNAVKGPGGIVMMHVFPITRGLHAQKTCSKLTTEGLCGIHPRRPLMCRTVPLAPGMPEFMQGMTISGFEQHGCASTTPRDGLELVFNGFRLQDGGYKKAWVRNRESMMLDRDVSMPILDLMDAGYHHLPSIEDIVLSAGATTSVSLGAAILAMAVEGIVSKEDAIDVLDRQMKLMHDMLHATDNTDDAHILHADLEACDECRKAIVTGDIQIMID